MGLDYKLIGERLKKARIKMGYTQDELSELMQVSVAYLSRIETGKTNISLKRLVQFCDHTNVSYRLHFGWLVK